MYRLGWRKRREEKNSWIRDKKERRDWIATKEIGRDENEVEKEKTQLMDDDKR